MDAAALDALFEQVTRDGVLAHEAIERAWQQTGPADGRCDPAAAALLSAAALLAIGVDFADFRSLPLWLARWQAATAHGSPPQPAGLRAIDRLRLDATTLQLSTLDHRFALDAPDVRAAAERLFAGLREGLWPAGDQRLLLAKALYDHLNLQYDEQRCEQVAALVHGAGLEACSVAWRVRWNLLLEYCLDWWGHPAAAAELRSQVRALTVTVTVTADAAPLAWGLAVSELRRACREDDPAQQDRLYEQLDRLRVTLRPGLLPRGLHWQAKLLLRRGQFGAALMKADLALSIAADVAVPARDQGVYLEARADALAGLQRWDEAILQAEQLRQHQTGVQGEIAEAIVLSLQVGRALVQGRPDATDLALALVRRAAARQWKRFLAHFPGLASQVVQIGLAAGEQSEFLVAVVHERRLLPPQPHQHDWPWRLRVHALGPLCIERDGQPLQGAAKAQRKPLELLMLLAAQGGAPLAAEEVIDALWPSLEADAPRASLDMALSRLRKLLNLPDAVVVADGQIGLDPALVWTDVGALRQLQIDFEQGRIDDHSLQSLLRGPGQPLLGGRVLPPALQARREALAAATQRTLRHAAAQLEAAQAWERAAVVYDKALAADPLDETLHAGLMRCHLALGAEAQALRCYRRCHDALQRGLGVGPGATLRALAARAEALARSS